jgi:hypothetical protein
MRQLPDRESATTSPTSTVSSEGSCFTLIAELRTLTSEPAATLKRAERTVELACLGTGTGEVERTLNFCDRLLLIIRSTHKGGT